MFLEDKLAKINDEEEKKLVIFRFLLYFLQAVQDVINYDMTVAILIDNK